MVLSVILARAVAGLVVVLALVAIAYQLAALALLRRFFARAAGAAAPAHWPAVSLLKPLHGAEPRLGANLASFLAQDYPAPVQMVCGVNALGDPAVGALKALSARHPGAHISLSTGPRQPGANAKMGNCAAFYPLARHDVLVLSDSDMVVGRDYLARVVAQLLRPGVGAVSCLYVGRGDAGVWSRIGAAIISWQTMPNMVLGLALGMARPCMGSTIAIRREVLEAIGGFGAFADILADDHAIGAAVHGCGLEVAIPPMLLVHAGAEGSARVLWRQHLRWAATVRDLAGAGHYGSVVTHALALALLAAPCVAVAGLPAAWGAGLVAAALAVRLALAGDVARRMKRLDGAEQLPFWLLPVADIFAFAVFLASWSARKIDWRGLPLTITGSGRIAHSGAPSND